MRKKFIAAIFAFIGLGSLVVFGGSPDLVSKILESMQNNPITIAFSGEAKASTKETNAAPVATPLPEHNTEFISGSQKVKAPEYILYDQMFRLIVKFGNKSEEQQGKGEQPAPLREYFQKEAKLNDEQFVIVQDSAERFVDEVAIIDAQARMIIENIRSGIPKGQPLADKKILEPTAELKDLQNKREELALHYRDYLRDQLGADQFADFQNFVQQNMRQVITAIPVETLRPAGEELKPLQRHRSN